MKRKTYYNVMRATKMLEAKGYTFAEASALAIKIFDEYDERSGRPVEWFIDKVLTKNDYIKEYGER